MRKLQASTSASQQHTTLIGFDHAGLTPKVKVSVEIHWFNLVQLRFRATKSKGLHPDVPDVPDVLVPALAQEVWSKINDAPSISKGDPETKHV